jgi:methionyl-tRNA synthetase
LTISNIQPWAKTTSPELAAAFKPLALETLRVCGILLQPFMPDTATKLLDALDALPAERTWAHATFGGGRVGNASGVKLFEVKTRKE